MAGLLEKHMGLDSRPMVGAVSSSLTISKGKTLPGATRLVELWPAPRAEVGERLGSVR